MMSSRLMCSQGLASRSRSACSLAAAGLSAGALSASAIADRLRTVRAVEDAEGEDAEGGGDDASSSSDDDGCALEPREGKRQLSESEKRAIIVPLRKMVEIWPQFVKLQEHFAE